MPQEDVFQPLLGRCAKDKIQSLCGKADVRKARQDEGCCERCIDAAVQATDICEALDVCEEALQAHEACSAIALFSMFGHFHCSLNCDMQSKWH